MVKINGSLKVVFEEKEGIMIPSQMYRNNQEIRFSTSKMTSKKGIEYLMINIFGDTKAWGKINTETKEFTPSKKKSFMYEGEGLVALFAEMYK